MRPLDLLQPVVVLVEDPAGLGDVDTGGALHLPRQLDQPVEVGAQHRVLARGIRHPLQPLELLARGLLDLLRHLGAADGLAQLGDLGALLVRFAELFLNLPELLAQDELALALVHLLLGFSPISRDSRSTSIR